MSFIPMGKTRSDFDCRDCGQKISLILAKNHPKYGRVINNETNTRLGGMRNEDHICPNRLQPGATPEQQRTKKNFKCERCKIEFSGMFKSCPNCFKRVCQACGQIRLPRYDETCQCECGHWYSEGIFTTRWSEYMNKYVVCEPVLNPVG